MIVVSAYDRLHNVVFKFKPIEEVEGMAHGDREDALSGKCRGVVGNQCTSPASKGIYWWLIESVEAVPT